MRACMYAGVCLYVGVSICGCEHVCMYAGVHIGGREHVRVCMYAGVHVAGREHVCMCVGVYMHAGVCLYVWVWVTRVCVFQSEGWETGFGVNQHLSETLAPIWL